MKNLVLRFLSDEAGATAIEYGLISALIAVAIIASAKLLGLAIAASMLNLATAMKGA